MSVVLPGVKIGRKSLVAAGSVVTKDVADQFVSCAVPRRWSRVLLRASNLEMVRTVRHILGRSTSTAAIRVKSSSSGSWPRIYVPMKADAVLGPHGKLR